MTTRTAAHHAARSHVAVGAPDDDPTPTGTPDPARVAGGPAVPDRDVAQSLRAHRDAFDRGHFLRVVNWHNTPATAADSLRRELAEYARVFSAVTLADLDRFYETGRWHLPRPGFLPVFYEGYRNSAEVAAPILEELGLTGWFFVCTGFLDTPAPLQEAYARAHSIGLVPEDLDRARPIAMTWDQVRDLSRHHVVTPHTASHESVGWIRTEEDVQREIVGPKQRMDAVTGQDSACFAWLEGTHYGHDPVNDEAVRRAGYRYVFSNTMIQRLPR